MSWADSLVILAIIALGSYVQTLTGFAFGLIVVGSITLLGLAPIEFTAFVVSTLSLFNSLIAVWGYQRQVRWRWLLVILLSCVPFTVLGIWLLTHLGQQQASVLELLLGLSIIGCSGMMLLRPEPSKRESSASAFALSGGLAGLMGGLFGTFGPPVAYLMYRQPALLDGIRATLQALFCMTSILRIALALGAQQLDGQSYWISLLGIPVVIVGTLLGRRYQPPLSDSWMRRLAFGLLLLTGCSLSLSALVSVGLAD